MRFLKELLIALLLIFPLLFCKFWEWWHFNVSQYVLFKCRKFKKFVGGLL